MRGTKKGENFMNKLFTKIATAFVGIAMAIGVGVAVGSNGEVSSAHAVDPSITATWANFGINGTAAQKIESTTGYSIKISSVSTQGVAKSGTINNQTAIPGSIKSVTVNGAKTGSPKTDGTFTVYGGTSSSSITNSMGKVTGLSSTAQNKTVNFSGNYTFFKIAVGSARTLIFTSLVITYSEGSSDYVGSLSVSPSTWTGFDSQTLSVSSFTVSGSKNGTAGAVTSSDYEYKGIGYMSSGNFVARDATFSSGNPTTADTRLAWKAKYPTTAGGSTYAWAYVTLSVTADSVQSIAISGSMTKTTYSQGDAWDPAGFTVKAYYASAPSTPVDVTNNAGLSWSYSPATTASTDTKSVTCTASFGGKSATSSAQSVTVNEKQNLGGIVDGEKYFIIATYNDNEYYLKSFSSTSAVSDSAALWPGDSSMPETDDNAWTFTATATDDCWSVTNNDGDTLYSIADNNGLRCGTSDHVWQLAIVNNALKMYNTSHISAKGMYLTLYQGTNWRTYNSTSGQQEINSTIRFVKYEEPVTLESVTVESPKNTFIVGDYFTLGSAVVTASYSDGTDVVVPNNDSGLSFKLNNVAISTSYQFVKADSGKTIVVTYEDAKERTASATGYSVTVNYATVTSIGLNINSVTLSKGGKQILIAEVDPDNADQTVAWSTSDSSVASISSTTGASITVTASSTNTGNATITATAVGGMTATCTVTVSGDPVLNLFDEDSENITSGSISKFTTDSNFYLNVVAENFVGQITYTWSSSNTSAISVDEEADEMCMFVIDGAGDTRLSCHAVGATSGNLTVYVDVHVSEPTVTSLTWNATNISAYSNQSLTSAIVNGWTVSYEKDNGDSGTVPFGTYDLYLGSEKITSLPRAWSTADDGKTMHVEYGNVSTTSISVQITEHLNPVMYSSWSLVTSVSELSAGDVIVFANENKGKAMSSTALKAGETLTVTDVTIENGEITSEIPSETAKFTLGGNSSDGWSFKCGDNYLYFSTTTNSRTMDLKSESSSYDISIDGETGDAIVGSTMRIVLNTSATPPRWSSYNTTTETSSMLFPEIYKASNSNIADTNATAQRALISFAKTFNTTMACDDGGDTANIESKWSSASSAFTTTMNALGTDDKTVFKRMVANASSVKGGDSLQDMLARYDYIIAKYKLSNDFLHDGADRGAVQYARFTPLNAVINSNNSIVIIIITAMASLAAIGGYFFLRKKKED